MSSSKRPKQDPHTEMYIRIDEQESSASKGLSRKDTLERETVERKTEAYQKGEVEAPRKVHTELELGRLAFAHNLLVIPLLCLITEAAKLQLDPKMSTRHQNQKKARVVTEGKRGLIYDRNLHVLANNKRTYLASIQARSYSQEELMKVYQDFPKFVPEILPERLEKLKEAAEEPIAENRPSYILLALHVEAKDYHEIRKALPMVTLNKQFRREYPKGDLAGPLLGHMSVRSENIHGLNGIERSYDSILRARDQDWISERDGKRNPLSISKMIPELETETKSIQLTLDMLIQQITESHLKDAVQSSDAVGGVAVVMDPNNGDILAMAQSPSYDPNQYYSYKKDNHQIRFTNHAISSVYEPGSTMKPLVVAAAIEEGVLNEDSILPGHGGFFYLGKHKVRDTHPTKEMTTLELLQYSSNIGAIHVGYRLGIPKLYGYLMQFGLGSTTEIGLDQELAGRLGNITQMPPKRASIIGSHWTYGYGLNTTPLQSAQAISVIANGGQLVTPRIVKALLNEEGEVIETYGRRRKRRVVGKKATDIVTKGMVLVTESGTGRPARVDGYLVAGKSGTTRKYLPEIKGYREGLDGAYLSTFVGFVPAEKPRVVIYVLINEPKSVHSGGKIAGPVFSKIAEEILPYLGVPPTRAQSKSQKNTKRYDQSSVKLTSEVDYQPWWSQDRFLTSNETFEVVPNLKGQDLPTLLNTLRELDADLTLQGTSGVVVSQLPEAGELLRSKRFTVQLARPMITEHQAYTGGPAIEIQASERQEWERVREAKDEQEQISDEGVPPSTLD